MQEIAGHKRTVLDKRNGRISLVIMGFRGVLLGVLGVEVQVSVARYLRTPPSAAKH